MGFEFLNLEHDCIASYVPRAFYILLNFDTQDNEREFPTFTQIQLSTLLHECGHLVQDRATLYGVQDFIHFYYSFWSIRAYVNSVPAGEPIPLPLRNRLAGGCIPGTAEPCFMAQLEAIRQVTYAHEGWTRSDTHWAFLSHRISEVALLYRDGNRNVRAVELHLVNNVNNEQYKHTLGAWEIKEAYSANVQVLHGGDPHQPGQGYEYLIVERILLTKFRDPSPEHIVTICHWALQSMGPAVDLLALVEELEENFGHELPGSAELYDYCRLRALRNGHAAEQGRLIDILDRLAGEHGRINADGHLGRILTWYAASARALLTLNIDPGRRFPLDTFLCDRSPQLSENDKQRRMRGLFAEIPVPMVQTLGDHWYAFGGNAVDDGHVFFIRSLKNLVDHIWAGTAAEWPCPLYPRCHLPLRDESCLQKPWQKGQQQSTCSYGAAARLLHLQDRIFATP